MRAARRSWYVWRPEFTAQAYSPASRAVSSFLLPLLVAGCSYLLSGTAHILAHALPPCLCRAPVHLCPQKLKKKRDEEAYWDDDKAEEAKARGNEAFREGNWRKAIDEYTEATKRNPRNAVYYQCVVDPCGHARCRSVRAHPSRACPAQEPRVCPDEGDGLPRRIVGCREGDQG